MDFVTHLTGILNDLNLELQRQNKTTTDMNYIHTFKLKLKLVSTKMQHQGKQLDLLLWVKWGALNPSLKDVSQTLHLWNQLVHPCVSHLAWILLWKTLPPVSWILLQWRTEFSFFLILAPALRRGLSSHKEMRLLPFSPVWSNLSMSICLLPHGNRKSQIQMTTYRPVWDLPLAATTMIMRN